ncbi:MAG: prepilin-type N-terminal cleavage/methylation domain-containing protein [Bacillus sp. (in: firmicutes)]
MRQLIQKKLKNEKGLTLIELLAVIVILGIIAAIAIPSISGIIQKSREDAVKADAITILNAAKNYVAANGVTEEGTANITKGQLGSYVGNVKFTGDYSVAVDGTTFKFSAAELPVGKAKLTFTNATIEQINNDKNKTGEDRTIGN